jgi:DivIVA domain-containing protein
LAATPATSERQVPRFGRDALVTWVAMADSSSPDAVATASFSHQRKGYDQGEVRSFLQQVSAALGRAQASEADLVRRLADARVELDRLRAKPPEPSELDEATVSTLLGQEAARVLTTAREGAASLRARVENEVEAARIAAEADIARTRTDADEETARQRAAAEQEAALIRKNAAENAERETESAKSQGREMVMEARAYRERVMADLARRRELARQQIEILRQQRARLRASFSTVELALGEIRGELADDIPDPDPLEDPAGISGAFPVVAVVTAGSSSASSSLGSSSSSPSSSVTFVSPTPSSGAAEGATAGGGVVTGGFTIGEYLPPSVSSTPDGEDESDSSVSDVAASRVEDSVTSASDDGGYGEVVDATGSPATVDGVSAEPNRYGVEATNVAAAEGSVAAADSQPGASEPDVDPLDVDSEEVGAADVAELVDVDSVSTADVRISDGRAFEPGSSAGTEVGSTHVDEEPAVELNVARDHEGSDTASFGHDIGDAVLQGAALSPNSDSDNEVQSDDRPSASGVSGAAASDDASTSDDLGDGQTLSAGRAGGSDDAAAEVVDDGTAFEKLVKEYDKSADASELQTVSGDGRGQRPVDDLFARIRASRVSEVADLQEMPTSTSRREGVNGKSAAPKSGTTLTAGAPDHVPSKQAGWVMASEQASDVLEVRTAALGPIEVSLGRRLKRALADEQSEALDLLRRRQTNPDADELFGSSTAQATRYRDAARDDLHQAARAGASSLATLDSAEVAELASAEDVIGHALDELERELANPLRANLIRTLDASGDDTEEAATLLRATYREWKVQRIDALVAHLTLTAHGRGAFAALLPGTPVCWIVDEANAPCAEGDDNALGGSVPCGEEFPTGHRSVPAYPGCRCALAPAGR